MLIDGERLIHSIKTGFACLIGFVIIKLLHSHFSFDQWLIVTILVVMCAQISVGGIFYKSILRFMGTSVGSLLAAGAIIYFGNDTLTFAATIALAGMAFSYVATGNKTYADVGTLGAVTTAIILINPNPSLRLAFERFCEITMGITIAALVSQFILPIHARTHLRRNQTNTIHLLSEYYAYATSTNPDSKEKINLVDEKIVQSLLNQRKLAIEAKQELLGDKFAPEQFKRIIDSEKGLLRSIDFLNRYYHDTQIYQFLENNSAWQEFNQKIHELFKQVAQQLEKPTQPTTPINLPSLGALQETLSTTYRDQPEALHKVEGLVFCLRNILNLFNNLTVNRAFAGN